VPTLVLRDGSRGLFAQQQAFATPIAVLMMFLGLVLLLACANMPRPATTDRMAVDASARFGPRRDSR
jgi:hypothetical protein